MTDTAIEALAEAWAEADGELSQYLRGPTRDASGWCWAKWSGRRADAQDLINRLAKRGWKVVRDDA